MKSLPNIVIFKILCFVLLSLQQTNCQNDFATTELPVSFDRIAFKAATQTDKLGCDFNSRACHWEGVSEWTWKSSYDSSQMKLDSPAGDWNHLENKWSLQANFSGGSPHHRLNSPEFTVHSSAACFTFSYYLPVDTSIHNALYISLADVTNHSNILIWAAEGQNIDRWETGKAQIDRAGTYQIKLEVYGTGAFIALKNFRLSSQACSTSICTFENGNCGWTSSGVPRDNDFAIRPAAQTGESAVDHTFDSPYGHVQYINLKLAHKGDFALLASPMLANLGEQCFTFWFYRTGTGVRLSLHRRYNGSQSQSTIWENINSVHLAKEWIRVQHSVSLTNAQQLVFKVDKVDGTSSALKLDDISVVPFACASPVTCQFGQERFCGWVHERSRSNLLWALGLGRVQNPEKLKAQTPMNANEVLYTDFTTIQNASSMELLSEFVNLVNRDACVLLSYKVAAISLKTDSFQLSRIDVNGTRTVLWSYNDSRAMSQWESVPVYVASPAAKGPYRLSLLAKSSTPSTYIGVLSLKYTTDLSKCGHGLPTTAPPATTTTTTLSPKKSLNCNFEDGTVCNWLSIQDFFKVTTPKNPKIDEVFRPVVDHTTSSPNGHFAYAISDSRSVYSTAGTMYGENPYPGKVVCLDFYYYLSGNSKSTFEVLMENYEKHLTIFSAPGAQDSTWRRAHLTVNQTAWLDRITFYGKLAKDSFLAIDDIRFSLGECLFPPDEKLCDFERGQSCIFEPILNRFNVFWKVYAASQMGIADHTTHTKDGHYYGVDLSLFKESTRSMKKRIEVESRQLDGSQVRCLQFSYLLANVSADTVLAYEIKPHSTEDSSPGQLTKWSVAGGTTRLWFTHITKLPPNVKFDLTMTVESNFEPAGKVFVDDVRLSSAPTSCSKPHSCDFDDGTMCTLESIQLGDPMDGDRLLFLAKTANFSYLSTALLTNYVEQLWHVFNPRQSAKYIQHDATYRNQFGNYLLMAAYHGDRAIVVTERYNLADHGGHVCFSLAIYQATNDNVLEIYQGESFNETHALKIWDLRRATRDELGRSDWETFDIVAYPTANTSIDIFFYIVGTFNDRTKYLALDDIQLKPQCSHPSNTPSTTVSPSGHTTVDPSAALYFTCSNGSTIPIAKVCDYVNDCAPKFEDEAQCGRCDFDNRLCRYLNESEPGDFAFRYRSQLTVKPTDGGSSHMILTTGNIGRARLSSPIIHQSYLSCELRFDYYYFSLEPANNDTNSEMKLYLQLVDLNNWVPIWQSTLEAMKSGSWHQIWIPLRRVPHDFRLVYVASQGHATPEKIQAIANPSLGGCAPEKPSSLPCEESFSFKCKNGVCIQRKYICDFQDNCGDHSDEDKSLCNSTLMTSFETGRGYWGARIFKGWQVTQAAAFTSLRQGPTYDQTSEYTGGSYLYVNAPYQGASRTVTAEMDSPVFRPITSECKLTFYKFANTQADWTLFVALEEVASGKRHEIAQLSLSYYAWMQYEYSLGEFGSELYRVIITATLQATANAFIAPYVALDDIAFSSQCTLYTDSVAQPTLPNHSTLTTPRPSNCSTISCTAPNGTAICIEADQFCDFITDCKDGTDEQSCGDCDFESGFCQWKNIEPGDAWTRVKPAAASVAQLPKRDADGNVNGGFLSILAGDPTSTSRLQSPVLNANTAPTCKLQFAYMNIKPASLDVYRNREGMLDTLFSTQETINQWKSFEVQVGAMLAGRAIEFWAKTKYSNDGFKYIALDNVKFIDCNPYKVYPTPKPGNISCDFENNLCGWEVTGVHQRSNWQRTSAADVEPGNDHTSLLKPQPSQFGTWLTTQPTTGLLNPSVDYLVTTVKLKGNQAYCFTFYFYFFGIDLSSFFALYATKTGKAAASPDSTADYTPLWRTEVPQGRNWLRQSVDISLPTDFYLIFIASVDSAGIIGLDDTNLAEGNCPANPLFCDFETTCDWKLQSGGFKRNAASVNLPDHSTGTRNGHFVQDDTTQLTAMTKALATMPIFSSSNISEKQHFCFRFWYYMSTDSVAGTIQDSTSMLSVMISQDDRAENISIGEAFNSGLLRQWSMFQLSFSGDRAATIEIDGLKTRSSTVLLLDDISVTHQSCSAPENCDFEADLCAWSNQLTISHNKRVLWLRIQPNSHYIKGKVLNYDHSTSTATGHYLVTPLQMAASGNSVLQSPLMSHNAYGRVCFSMFYFAQTTNSSVVALVVRLLEFGRRKTYSMTVNGTTDLRWVKFEQQLENLPDSYAIQIESANGGHLVSDIGLDDIKLSPGRCFGSSPTTTTPVPISETALDCTFENGPCNWSYDDTVWRMGSFAYQSTYAPVLDHTLQSTSGRYLMFQLNKPNKQQITSTRDITAGHEHCLTLWYYNDGEYSFMLDVELVTSQSTTVYDRYHLAIENRRRWNLIKANIPSQSKPAKVAIRYEPSEARTRHYAVFALDDIRVRPGRCGHLHDYVYNFEAGLEDLQLEFIQPITSGIGERFSPAGIAGPMPSVDHTTNSKDGTYFLFMNRLSQAPTTYIDTLAIVDLPADQAYTCLRFAYQISGNVTLRIYKAPNSAVAAVHRFGAPMWMSTFPRTTWTIAEVNKMIPFEHQVVFYMEKPDDKSSFVALDDLTVLSHRCQAPIDCDFNGRICSYSPLSDDTTTSQYNWGLLTAPAYGANWPGPRYDHSTGDYGGGYLFLTTYQPNSTIGPTTSRVVSKVISGPRAIQAAHDYCLSLWTRLNSPTLSLQLSIRRYGAFMNDSNRTVAIASMKHPAVESDWTQATIPISASTLANTHEIQLIIDGILAANSTGVIALDDIRLVEGECESKSLTCEDGTILKSQQICNFIKECPSGLDELNCGNANFEGGKTGGWMNMTTSPETWLLTNARESGNKHAPAFDADATTNGHYLLVSPPKVGLSSTAETALNFASPANYLKNAYATCVMQFDYFIFSTGNHRLDVRIGGDRTDWATIYSISRVPTGGWRKAKAHIGTRSGQFMADLVGHLDDGKSGIMAVDNIQFANCSIPKPLGPKEHCSSGQFFCAKYRFCISIDQVCNFVDDCFDNSDEPQSCLSKWTRCDFEHSLATCDISTNETEPLSNSVQWILKEAKMADLYEPHIDNTQRTGTGKYLVLESIEQSSHLSAGANFYSPMMTSANQQSCRMRFFSFINGEPTTISGSHLSIYIRLASKLTIEPLPIAQVHPNQDSDLQRWSMSVAQYQSAQPFQFVFHGELGTNQSRVAVDDISFDPSGCLLSNVKPAVPTSLPLTTSPGSSVGHQSTTPTAMPHISKPKARSPSGGLLAGIIVPFVVAFLAIMGYLAYRKYQQSRQTSENIVLTMKGLQTATKDSS